MADSKSERRVALLTNFLPHYRLPLLEELQSRVGKLRVFLSAPMEKDRSWAVAWGKLDVVVQRSFSWTHYFRNVHGYRDWIHIHVPYDTFFQLLRYKPDAIITGEFGLRTLMSVLYGMTRPETTLILWATCSEHTEATRGQLRRRLRRWLVKRVDGVFVNGESGARYLAAIGFRGPTFPVPYVVDNHAFPAGSPAVLSDSVRLFYSGQLIERKGLHLFLPVLSRWCADHPERSVVLQIAGDGHERARIQAISAPANLSVELLGNIVPDKLAACYQAASIFVFPTLGDEWGTVVNEALCSGLPVVGSVYSQAVEELIREGANGWQFDPLDPASAYSALDRALSVDRETYLEMSQNARATMDNLTPASIAAVMAGAVEVLHS